MRKGVRPSAIVINGSGSWIVVQLMGNERSDWQQRWGYRPVVVETFVDPNDADIIKEPQITLWAYGILPLIIVVRRLWRAG